MPVKKARTEPVQGLKMLKRGISCAVMPPI
jgi:hypothetical protein